MKKILNNNITKNLIIFLIPFTIFIILFYAYYPGIITYDGNFQWQQVQSNIITNSHPFFSTFFMLILSKIHNSTSTIIFYQITVFSLLWTYICKYTRNNNKDYIVQILYTIVFCLVPIISNYAITLWKDILYSYYLIGISYIFYIGIRKDFNYNKFEIILTSILLFLVYSYRHNGKIVAILLIVFIILYFKKKNKIKDAIIILLFFIALNLIVYIPKNIYLNQSEKNNSESVLSDIDSYIFWMYSAHLRDGNITSKEDLDFLNNVADIDKWKEIYHPYVINSTNRLEKDVDFVIKNNKRYKSLFFETTIKYPLSIVKHYLTADELLWSPYKKGYVYLYDFSKWDYPYDFSNIEETKIPIVRKYYHKILNYTFKEPINILFHNPANLMYMSIILTIILSFKLKNKKYFILLIPMFSNTISLIPINLAQDMRYVYINYLTFFFILFLFILNIKTIIKKVR